MMGFWKGALLREGLDWRRRTIQGLFEDWDLLSVLCQCPGIGQGLREE